MHPLAHAKPLRLDVSHAKRSFEVLSCKGSEILDQPYVFELEIINPDGALNAHELLFSTAYLHAKGSSSGIHGHIQSIVRSTTEIAADSSQQVTSVRYLISLGPRLGLMAYRHNQRIFQGMSADRIIAQVLDEHGIDQAAYLWQRKQPCLEREYCAQHRESDLQLLQRLCGEEGMHYYFVHTRNRHVVVFTDNLQESLPCAQSVNDRSLAAKAASRQAGVLRACVVGGLFEPARQDAQGRLKVRLDGCNQGDGARFNDCWIPVDPSLTKGESLWWGGLEVVVRFRDGNPDAPYVSDRLWDPDINPRARPEPVAAPRRVLTTRIDKAMFLDQSQQFSVDDRLLVQMARHNEMHFRVGDSQVTIDSQRLSLSGLKIILTSIAEAEGEFQAS